MSFDLQNVQLSYRDKVVGTKLPTEPSEELAELLGILAGDGYVASYGKDNNNRISITGHLRDDYAYLKDVNRIIEFLFGIKFRLYSREALTTVNLERRSQAISQFLQAIGYQKIHCITRIPHWIWQDEKLTKCFIRGLFDTDGSLCLKKNHGRHKFYPVIDITLKDEILLRKVANWAHKSEVPHCLLNATYTDKRTNKTYRKFKLQISGYKNAGKWIKLIGTSNPTKQHKMELAGLAI